MLLLVISRGHYTVDVSFCFILTNFVAVLFSIAFVKTSIYALQKILNS